MLNKKKLYILIGPAGAGKTTWVREHATPGTSAHISRDRIRFNMVKEDEYYFSREDDVYAEFVKQIADALQCPWVDEVYADATHLTTKARHKLVLAVEEYFPYFDLAAVIIKPELEKCLVQNAQRMGREFVPETVIRNMYDSFQHPFGDDLRYDEIFENDVCVYGTEGN